MKSARLLRCHDMSWIDSSALLPVAIMKTTRQGPGIHLQRGGNFRCPSTGKLGTGPRPRSFLKPQFNEDQRWVWRPACLVKTYLPSCYNNSHATGHSCAIQAPWLQIWKHYRRRYITHLRCGTNSNVVRCSQLQTGKLKWNLSP